MSIHVPFDVPPVRHFQDVWLASGDYFQTKWNSFLSITGDDPYNLLVWGTTIYTILIYWGFCGFYMFFDFTNRPKFLRKFKVQPGTNEPLDKKLFFKVTNYKFYNLDPLINKFPYIGNENRFIQSTCYWIRTNNSRLSFNDDEQ